jgi:hypothetical protein
MSTFYFFTKPQPLIYIPSNPAYQYKCWELGTSWLARFNPSGRQGLVCGSVDSELVERLAGGRGRGRLGKVVSRIMRVVGMLYREIETVARLILLLWAGDWVGYGRFLWERRVWGRGKGGERRGGRGEGRGGERRKRRGEKRKGKERRGRGGERRGEERRGEEEKGRRREKGRLRGLTQ